MKRFKLMLLCMCIAGTGAAIMSAGTTGSTQLACNTTDQSVSGSYEQLANIVAQYFRRHGVYCLILVISQLDIATSAQRQGLYKLVRSFIAADYYLRIFNADDEQGIASTEQLNVFGPTRTFKVDNDTRRALPYFRLHPLWHKSGILVLSFEASSVLNMLRWSAAPEHNYFTTNRFWLLLAKRVAALSLLDQDVDIFIPPDSEVRLLLRQQADGPFSLIDMYKVGADRPLKRRMIAAHFDSAVCMLHALQHYGSAISHREDLEGITFNTGLVVAFPDLFTNIEDLSMRHIDTISKVNHRLMLELANKLHLHFNTHQTDNYGWRKPNGSFDGLMGSFQRYELDFAQLAIFMRLDRIEFCDFVAETYRVRAGLMFRQPPLSAVANIFAMPFDSYVWFSILLLMLFTITVLALELWLSPYVHKMNLLDCVVFVWGAMCQQGFYMNVSNRSARIIVLSTFVATLFLFTSFSANIVALLQSPSEAIQSLADLSSSPLDIGMQDTQYNKIFFTESNDMVTNRLYHKKIAPKGDNVYMRPLIGMEKMRTSLFAYQVELQAGYQIVSDTFSESEKCGLKELEPFTLPMIAIPTRKNFPYKELFRRQLRWQREVGLMSREERKWIPQKPICESGIGGFVSIGLTECRYALAMFGCGLLLGSMVFIAEVLWQRFISNRFKRTQLIIIE